MLRLGEDDHGIWLGMPAGTVHSKSDQGPVYESKEDDEDEFAAHQVRYSYPPDVIAKAAASADWLQTALRTGAEPFNSHFRSWLAKVS